MPVDRAFLKPRSVDKPPQGDFVYLPQIFLLEDTTQAGLEAQFTAQTEIRQQSIAEFWVVESVQYSTAVTAPKTGMNPAEMLYSVMIHATKCLKV